MNCNRPFQPYRIMKPHMFNFTCPFDDYKRAGEQAEEYKVTHHLSERVTSVTRKNSLKVTIMPLKP